MLISTQKDAAQRPIVPAAWALAALALFLFWQFLTVHYNRGGNWTALFLTGRDYPTPPELISGTYRFPGAGYDGEMYRYVAHDPFLRLGYARYLDAPEVRYRRILVPVLAYLSAGGHQPSIDSAYIGIIALFVFAGAYWLGQWGGLVGAHPAWAIAFLLVPASLVSMERMTVDVALAAFTVAFALYWRTNSKRNLFVALLLACLVRETGFVLVAAICLFDLLHGRFARIVLWCSAALPALAWYVWIRLRLPAKAHSGMARWLGKPWAGGPFHFLLHPPRYPLSYWLEPIARSADVFALAAILLASILAILLLRAQPLNPLGISAALFVVLVFFLSNDAFWLDVNGYARLFSPLLVLIALPSIARETRRAFPWWLGLVPASVADLRLGFQFPSEISGIVRGLLRL